MQASSRKEGSSTRGSRRCAGCCDMLDVWGCRGIEIAEPLELGFGLEFGLVEVEVVFTGAKNATTGVAPGEAEGAQAAAICLMCEWQVRPDLGSRERVSSVWWSSECAQVRKRL